MSVNVPSKMPVPFANAGLKNTIPPTTDNVNGLAGYSAGFGVINMTPKTAGGIPPFGQDFNGILFAITEGLRFFQAGSIYTYDSTFSTAVGGYRAGARVLRTDGAGYWLNLTDANTTDPESAGAAAAGWVPDFTNGVASITMTNANVTLTPLQYGKPIIAISGTLTANLNLTFPNIADNWSIINNTTGAFAITCKTAAGTGVIAAQGAVTQIIGDATNIYSTGSIQQATETFLGGAEIATQTETNTGTDDQRIVTPLKLKSGFAISLSANGYIKLPTWMSGLIIQWGESSAVASASTTVTFPIAFPNNCWNVFAGPKSVSGGQSTATNLSNTLSTAVFYNFNIQNGALAVSARYIAIGN